MIIARLLVPEDYGLVAIISVVLVILQTINEIGFGAALMQKLDRDELDFNSVFYLNIILGLTLYAVMFISAPIMASYFDSNRLIPLIQIAGFNLIITSFVVVQRTIFVINVNFKVQAKASLIAIVFSGLIGILLAYKGCGAYALIIQTLLFNLINAILIWIYSYWRPKLLFSFSRLKSLFQFASKLILARLINSIFEQTYNFVIGKCYSTADLGLYNRASSFKSLTSNNIVQIVQRVSTPILCENQQSHKQMGEILIRFIQYTALLVFPILIGLMVLAKPLVLVLLTAKW